MSRPDRGRILAPSPRGVRRPVERRSTRRRLPADGRGTILWPDATGEFASDVVVLNVGGGGAAVLGEESPPDGPPRRLRLRCRDLAEEAIDATVVDTSLHPTWRRTLHLQFDRGYDLGAGRARPRDRRLWECYAVGEVPASVQWSDGGGTRTIRGVLLNISGGGAAFGCEAAVPAGIPVRLRLEFADAAAGGLAPVVARIVAITEDQSGIRIAHLEFVEHCPIPFFDLAVNRRS